ncbi:hypothetical protein HXX76_013101 [Chlamydomonas incerta]|uniref:SRCR domain-containing protein n=1 Tax=Chlamydomonas incerta TaxID=51695 RepID=A0A835VUU8_CHLIN|nr:hypothetical protein HXX76_013101 [Chlamydomonas incerta]|eukprot:KAG2426344.1 hypothetical protein HXX76_013101 [Chlamydomonas incerta]
MAGAVLWWPASMGMTSTMVFVALAALALPGAHVGATPPSTDLDPGPPSDSMQPRSPLFIATNDDLTPIDFPPPEFNFGDYNSPPPIESDNPPYIPRPPVASPPPPGTRVPPQPPSPPRTPSPPPRPPSPPPSPPNPIYGPLPMRLVGGADNSSGVVEIWNEKEKDWGALCFPIAVYRYTLYVQGYITLQDSDVAKLICRQLGQPYLGAELVHPDAFPSVATARLRGWAVSTNAGYSCPNAGTTPSVVDCDDIELLPKMSTNCQSAILINEPDGHLRNYVPTGVVCTDTPRLRPPVPPSLPPSPPPGVRPAVDMSIPATNYTMRIVHQRSGLTTYRNGSRVTKGRLEVLLPRLGSNGTRQGEPVWGTVCVSAGVPDEVAKYACRSNGLPYKAAYTLFGVRPKQPKLASVPVHWVVMRGCTNRADGLACAATLSRQDITAFRAANRAAVRAGLAPRTLPYEDISDMQLQYSMAACDKQGHQVDAYINCVDTPRTYFSPPSPPPPPPRPPYPPSIIRNSVQLNVTTIADNLYYIMFGVPVPGGQPGELVWGHFCPRNPNSGTDDLYIDRTAANAACNQITRGARPYGYYNYLQTDKTYPWPLLPPHAERLSRPVVLEGIDCSMVPPPATAYDGGTVMTETERMFPRVDNLSLCEVTPAAYPPEPLPENDYCSFRAWGARRLISCTDSPWIETPYMTGMRLVGGDANGTWGRLQIVLHREFGDYVGWGTVCAPDFTIQHAQGVCRDLGLGWTEARLLPTSAAAPLEDPDRVPILMQAVYCFANRVWWTRPWEEEHEQPPSFRRDCRPGWRGSIIGSCDHRSDVVIQCGGSAEIIHAPVPGPPPSAVQPTAAPPAHYGPYGSTPPPYGGAYGGYGSYPPPPPPSYGAGPYGGPYGGYGA